MGSQRFKNWC